MPIQRETMTLKGSVKYLDGEAECRAVARGYAEASASFGGVVEMIDTYDQPGDASACGTYAGDGTFVDGFEDKPGKRIPKAGAYAGAGVGVARAQVSVFDAEAKGPNASVAAVASVASGAKAFARAELASASASAGPFKATVGLAVDTGVGISLTCFEAKLLGTGFSIGSKTSVSVLGNSIECRLM